MNATRPLPFTEDATPLGAARKTEGNQVAPNHTIQMNQRAITSRADLYCQDMFGR